MPQWRKNKSHHKATWKDKAIMWSVVILLGLIHASIKDSQSNEENKLS